MFRPPFAPALISSIVARLRRAAGEFRKQAPVVEGHRPAAPTIGAFGLLSGSGDQRPN